VKIGTAKAYTVSAENLPLFSAVLTASNLKSTSNFYKGLPAWGNSWLSCAVDWRVEAIAQISNRFQSKQKLHHDARNIAALQMIASEVMQSYAENYAEIILWGKMITRRETP
jgi:hypothetical protein